MYIYFKDKELALKAMSSSTDKTDLLKRYGDRYRFNVYDLSFKERTKFFNFFCDRNLLEPFQIEDKYHDIIQSFLFLKGDFNLAVSMYRDILNKFKGREDVVAFLSVVCRPHRCVEVVWYSNNKRPEDVKYLMKIWAEDMEFISKRFDKISDREAGC